MGVNTRSNDRLSCGADLADMVEQVADRRAVHLSGHQSACVVCQRALEELSSRWEFLRRYAAEPVPVPETLLSRVLGRVRAVATAEQYVVIPTSRGLTRISTWVVGRVAKASAARVSGVTGVTVLDVRLIEPQAEQGGLIVKLQLTVRYGWDLLKVSQEVRGAVAGGLSAWVGIGSSTVEISVGDIHVEA